MSLKRQIERTKVARVFWRACRAMNSFMQEEAGVTAIEYALLAALIVIVAAGSIASLGGGVGGMWTGISTNLLAAL